MQDSLSFGGEQYTLTDYSLLNQRMTIDNMESATKIREKLVRKFGSSVTVLQKIVANTIREMVLHLIDKVKTENTAVPLILVGGGSSILPDSIEGVTEIIRPEHFEVANAYGACIAQISGEAEKVFNLTTIDREAAIENVKSIAIQQAIDAGALPDSIQVMTVNDTPLAYLPNATKVKVKVCGELVVF